MAKKKDAAAPVAAPAAAASADSAAPAAAQVPAPANAPAPAPKPPKDEQNGVTRPKAGSKTGRVWEIADTISQAIKGFAGRKEVFEACSKEGINPATTATQFGLWRRYYGLVNVRGPRQPKAEAAPAAGSADSSAAPDAPPPAAAVE